MSSNQQVQSRKKQNGFTLIELSLVIIITGLLVSAALRYAASTADAKNTAATNATLDAIDAAIMNMRVNGNRLPCPADIYQSENSTVTLDPNGTTTATNFGTETENPNLYDGLCTGANFINSTTDPDNADALYDATSLNNIVAGGVPTKALKLPDKYAYDAWGRKILYVVDKRFTSANAFVAYSAIMPENMVSGGSCGSTDTCTAGAIVVKQNNADSLANAITYGAAYVLVSYGKNGHGGYAKNINAALKPYNYGSTNTDELKNCHCTSAAVAANFDRIFVQKPKTVQSTSATNSAIYTSVFDDIVTFKTRIQLAIPQELQ